MICTAKINGITVEINGTTQECAEFLRDIWRGLEEVKSNNKVCNPLARHYGNCGAEDCPIIAPGETKSEFLNRIKR